MVFLVEPMLGSLARWLRLMGLDASSIPRAPATIPPGHLLLTRRRALASHPGVLLIAHDRLAFQLRQTLTHTGLVPDPARFFTRCLDCNLTVHPLDRDHARGLVPDHTWHTAPSFTQCPGCAKVFWPGSHGQRARSLIEEELGGKPLFAPSASAPIDGS
jgi:hypothetical protein